MSALAGRTVQLIIYSFCILCLTFGCAEDSSSTAPGGGTGGTSPGPIFPNGDAQLLIDAGNLTDGQVLNGSDAQIDTCTPGEKECVIEGGDSARECNAAGMWITRRCLPDEACSAGECRNSAIGCTNGSTVCLSNGSVGICENDAWIDQGPCGEGLSCNNGTCVSSGCVAALRGSSYIGCEFLTLDLANSAFDSRDQNFDGLADGTTVNSPTGLVVANNSSTGPPH